MSALAAGLAPAAWLQEQGSQRGGLDEIVVTTQFKGQNVQDTPFAIKAISGDTLDVLGQNSLTEIAAQAPNVTLTKGSAFAGPSLIAFIRAVGQTDFNPALEPGVGVYVDDVYYSTLTGSVLDLLNLDRVEVLRGPQGSPGRTPLAGHKALHQVSE